MKWIENGFRNLCYFLFRIYLRNKQVPLPLDGSSFKKILILRYDVLGDMVVTTPVFHLLKEKLPRAEIHVVGTKRNVGLLKHDEKITKIICYDETFRSLLKLRRMARREGYDCVIALVFYKATKAGAWSNWLGGRKAVKITWANPKRAHLYTALFNAQIPASPNDLTMSEIHVKFLCDSFGWEYSKDLVQLSIALSAENEAFAEEYFRQFKGAKTLLINASAGNYKREMTLNTVEELLELLMKFYPEMYILLNVAPTDSLKFAVLSARYPEKVHMLPYSPDILNFCALVQKCSAVISPDTAVVHIASTFEIPIVGLYNNSASHTKRWGPQHSNSVIVMSEDKDDLRTISSQRIFQAFQQLHNQYPIV